MPKYRITAPDGKTYEVNAPEGATEEQVLAYAKQNYGNAPAAQKAAEAPAKPFGQQMNETVRDVPRQLGLTARYGIEGLGGIADVLASPFRVALNAGGANIQGNSGGALADLLGLPQPKTSDERVVGDMSRMVAGGVVPISAGAALAKGGSGVAQKVGQFLSARPAAQLGSAAAAGGAGGYTRETGGDAVSQFLASLVAGIAAPMAMGAAQKAGASVAGAARRMTAQPQAQNVQVDVHINNALEGTGLTMADIPANVQRSIREDVSNAMNVGRGTLSPDAIRRLADYRLTNMTPTAATLTRDPAMYTQQANLAKLGANSKDPAAQELSRLQQRNNAGLIENLNQVGAGTTDDALAGGQRIIQALGSRNQRAQDIINQRYAAARGTEGRSANLDPSAFTQRASDLLDQALLGGKLPSDVRNLLNRTAQGEMPLTVDVAEQIKTRIGDLQRATMDRSERTALGMVRQALEETPLLEGQGQQAINAFNRARSMNRGWMNIVDRTPALQAVRDGIEPDKFVQQFIVGSGNRANVRDAEMLRNSIKGSPEAMQAVKDQIARYLKQQALGGATDEVGNFSQSAFNKAMNSVGDRKLRMFFNADEFQRLKAVGRVSSYEQVQPKGSAVNNSNTAGALGSIFERIADSSLMSKIPLLGPNIGGPLQNISVGMQSGRALNVPPSLLMDAPRLPQGQRGLPLSPAALLFLQQQQQEQ